MGKNYVESSLKRFLKRKVKITLGLVVAFMITGAVGYAEEITGEEPFILTSGEKTIEQDSLNMNFNKNEVPKGIRVEPKNTSSIAKAKIETSNNIDIFVKHYDPTGICVRNGGELEITSKNIVINTLTEKVNPNETNPNLQYSIAMGIDVDNNPYSSGLKKGGKVNITAETVNITAEAKQDAGWAYGINCITRTTNSVKEDVSRVVINAKDAKITAISKTKGASNGIIAWSQGEIFINNGNISITADNIINTRGNALVELNKNNAQNTVKLNGDILFEYDSHSSGTKIDGNIYVNLSDANSIFNGKIYVVKGLNSGKPIGEYDSNLFIVRGMNLGLYNGGTWNVKGDSFVNDLTINGGVLNLENNTLKVVSTDTEEKINEKIEEKSTIGSLKMAGATVVEGVTYNSIIKGNGIIKSVKQTTKSDSKGEPVETIEGTAITVTNKGNILELGENSSIEGNVFVETGAELTNNGTLKVIGTLENNGVINLSKGKTITLDGSSSFENKKGATLNVESGATAVTGGTTTNNGVISLKDTDNSDKTVSKLLAGGTLTNEGTIALADRAEAMTDENWNKLLETLITDKGTFTNKGMVVDKAGNSIFSAGTTIESGTAGELLESGVAGSGETIKIEDKQDGTTITGSTSQEGTETTTDTLKDITVNVEGNLTLKQETVTSGTGAGVVMEDVTMNVSSGKNVTATGEGHKLSGNVVLNGESSIVVGDGQGTSDSNLTLSGAVSQGAVEENKATKIEVKQDGTLNLVDATVNVAINSDATGQTGAVTSKGETSIKDITAKSLDITGASEEVNITTIDGNVNIETIIVGDSTDTKGEKTNILVLSADTVLGTPSSTRARLFRAPADASTIKIEIGGENGQLALELGENGKNALGNSSGIGIIGTSTDKNNKDLLIKTAGLSGKENTINLGDNAFTNVGVTSDSKIYLLDTILKQETTDGKDTTVTLKYNDKLFEGNSILNNINAQAFDVSNFFSSDEAEREAQLDKIYSSNIYSETVKATYDTVKMNEEAVLSLARKSEVGKWTAEGKALYSKDEYNRKGTVGEYSSEIESTGLMAAFGYGLNETTTAGIAFSGVKQDVDTDGGSADADLFYLGLYGNKVYGNYDFTAGLGYQFGEYEADNTIANVHGSDKYDSKALSGYVQGRYTADLGDGLSLQPRVRLGYTYVEQDDTRDSYFGVSDTEITTFDAEFGLDTVKSVQLEKSKVDVKFGVSYVRTMGDTDDEFTGRFYGTTASEGFNVLGAELAENVVKFNLGAEVTNENGFFYNGGLTYEFGSNDTDVYGVNVGVGYKF